MPQKSAESNLWIFLPWRQQNLSPPPPGKQEIMGKVREDFQSPVLSNVSRSLLRRICLSLCRKFSRRKSLKKIKNARRSRKVHPFSLRWRETKEVVCLFCRRKRQKWFKSGNGSERACRHMMARRPRIEHKHVKTHFREKRENIFLYFRIMLNGCTTQLFLWRIRRGISLFFSEKLFAGSCFI